MRHPFELGVRSACRPLLFLLATGFLLPSALRAEEYLLQPGDVLRVAVIGSPELAETVPIEMDGTAWFPLVGAIQAGGLSLSRLRQQTADAYKSMSASRPIEPGGSLPPLIDPGRVHVLVSEYRPIFLGGDVAHPREIPFRPGMTLQQVLSLASRPLADGRVATPEEIEAAVAELGREYAKIWRLKRFLGLDAQENQAPTSMAENTTIQEIVEIERATLREWEAALSKEKALIAEGIERMQDRIKLLERQRESEASGLELDEESVAQTRDLFRRGLVPATRLAEVRRAALVTASRMLETEVAIDEARNETAELDAEAVALQFRTRSRALGELGDALTQAQAKRARLVSLVAGRGIATALAGTQLTAQILRGGETLDVFEPNADSRQLHPGDVIKVRMRVDTSLGGPTNLPVRESAWAR